MTALDPRLLARDRIRNEPILLIPLDSVGVFAHFGYMSSHGPTR